jgi:hypothetical protein
MKTKNDEGWCMKVITQRKDEERQMGRRREEGKK